MKIIKDPNGVYQLERNGQILNCPFKTGAAAQNEQGIMFINQNCDSNCALFDMREMIGSANMYAVKLCKTHYEGLQITERSIHMVPKIVK
jgi:hypothetical protein